MKDRGNVVKNNTKLCGNERTINRKRKNNEYSMHLDEFLCYCLYLLAK